MLDTVDLGAALGRAEYEKAFWPLRDRLAVLQRSVYEAGIPVAVLVEGFDAAGKGDTIEKMVGRIDPRGYRVHATGAPTQEEQQHPFLWRFWRRIPARGEMAIFDRSWYRRVLADRVEKAVPRKVWQLAYDEINQFERTLADDGVLIVKFFLHVSRGEQRRRLRKMERNPYQSWRVTRRDWTAHRRYRELRQAADEMLERTHTAWAPWTPVAATDRRWRRVRVFEALAGAMERALVAGAAAGRALPAGPPPQARKKATRPRALSRTVLDDVDLGKRFAPARYQAALDRLQKRLRDLEFACWEKGVPVLVAYEGWDAAGKGGSIRRLIGSLDPRGYAVLPIAAPKGDDATHHYLWRFWNRVPRAGQVAIFDRSWYGRVLVERVEGLCREEEWRRAYSEINEFERSLHHFGAVIVKFWLHISREEQLRRFRERERVALKRYKITDEDWRNREKWEAYRQAVHDMITQTSTSWAPWTIVEAEDKNWARIRALRAVAGAIEERLG
jgi:AMP-polyphosphate phosphotransferase